LKDLKGTVSLGHTRYSTYGESRPENLQPLIAKTSHGTIAIAHNGTLTNALCVRNRLEKEGSIFSTTTDSEIILHLIARSRKKTLKDAIIESLKQIEGAYSVVILKDDTLYAVRDPNGFRPLIIGKKNSSFLIASETCALDIVNGDFVREVQPGELITIRRNEIYSEQILDVKRKSFCIFEFIYFSRPDSYFFGKNVNSVRERDGLILARETKIKADYVVPVPDSALAISLGFSKGSGIEFKPAFVRNHYVGRTFIEPAQKIRDLDVKIKLNLIKSEVEGKDIVIVDDSIVRGTTSKKIVQVVRAAGVRKINFCVGFPPIRFPCYYGIDFARSSELVASNRTLEEVRDLIGADYLNYISEEGVIAATGMKEENFCTACFSGKYPIEVKDIPLKI
jgi:amidophosphoribosyltransferase